jgi:hypothetical protein
MERYLRELEAKNRRTNCKHFCWPKEYCTKIQHRIIDDNGGLYHCQNCTHYERRGLK